MDEIQYLQTQLSLSLAYLVFGAFSFYKHVYDKNSKFKM